MKRLRAATDVWVDHPTVDYAVVALVVLAIAWTDPSSSLDPPDHGSWYQALVATSGVLLTLGSIVVTLVFTVTPNDRLQRVFDAVGYRLQQLVSSSLGALVITTLGFAGLFPLAVRASQLLQVTATGALVMFMLLRFGRLWWLLTRVLQALILPPDEEDAHDPGWVKPELEENNYELRTRDVADTH